MTPRPPFNGDPRRLRRIPRAGWIAPLLALASLTGCAQMQHKHPPASPALAPAVAPPPAPVAAAPSLSTIVAKDLQVGRYAEGEQALREYLQAHPGDRAAQALLRQLTGDPEQQLGRAWQPYVVRAGDSYSTLAARYLGDAGLFLVLARYNGSNNPSLLRLGQTVHLPLAAKGAASGAAEPAVLPGPASTATPAAPANESPQAKAARLQEESVTLLKQGRKTQALARLDEALALDPSAKPIAGTEPLRQQLVAVYHERAIVLYRDQQLDPAIALWDRVLRLDPSYEPAMVYRARALELKQRLKQL